jgi:hypothetical protein
MRAHSAAIDIERNLIIVQGHEINVQISDQIGCYRVVSETVTLPPRTEIIVNGEVENRAPVSFKVGLVEPTDDYIKTEKAIEVKMMCMFDCMLCQKEFVKEELLKTHLLECVKEITKMNCMECGAVLKKRAYLNRHLKRIHGQGTSGQDTGVKLVEVVPPAVETERNESDHELSSDDDIERYDPGNLIGEVRDSVDEDGSEFGITDKQPEVSEKVAKKDKITTANNIEQGRTIHTRFSLTPVYTPGKKASHEIKDAETPLVKAIEKDSTHAPSLIRKKEESGRRRMV